jgi:hypothetical protein
LFTKLIPTGFIEAGANATLPSRRIAMKLRWLLSYALVAIMLVGLAGLGVLFQVGLRAYGTATAEEAVQIRTEALSAFLSRALYEEWRRVEALAGLLEGQIGPGMDRSLIASLAQDEEKVSWIGIADAQGTVQAASRDMLVGENVGQRPWFQQGLQGPFAGDVHEAVLLTRLLSPSEAEPLRFVDFSAPVLDANGNVSGVLGAHINWRWVRQLVEEAAERLHLDVFLVNRSGTILLGTANIEEELTRLNSFQAARMGRMATNTEVWPNGQTYFTTTQPEMGYRTLPPFGWSMVARLDSGFVTNAQTQFQTRMLLAFVVFFLAVVVLFALIAAFLLSPLQKLADHFLLIAKGEPTPFIREHRRFREINVLSDAMALLQSRADRPDQDKKAASGSSQR